MERLDETGKACPIPVIETKRLLEASPLGTSVEVIVDNATAVQNLTKFAEQRGYRFDKGDQNPGDFHVVLTRESEAAAPVQDAAGRRPVKVVVVSSRTMGEGDERLGTTLLKGFLYALTEQDAWPDTVLFYNGGAHCTVEGSESLADLRKLEDAGVEILTCGTCLNHYGLSEKLAVGGVTNMYRIVELQLTADVIIKP